MTPISGSGADPKNPSSLSKLPLANKMSKLFPKSKLWSKIEILVKHLVKKLEMIVLVKTFQEFEISVQNQIFDSKIQIFVKNFSLKIEILPEISNHNIPDRKYWRKIEILPNNGNCDRKFYLKMEFLSVLVKSRNFIRKSSFSSKTKNVAQN